VVERFDQKRTQTKTAARCPIFLPRHLKVSLIKNKCLVIFSFDLYGFVSKQNVFSAVVEPVAEFLRIWIKKISFISNNIGSILNLLIGLQKIMRSI